MHTGYGRTRIARSRRGPARLSLGLASHSFSVLREYTTSSRLPRGAGSRRVGAPNPESATCPSLAVSHPRARYGCPLALLPALPSSLRGIVCVE